MPTNDDKVEFADRLNRLLRESKESLSDDALAEALSLQSGVSFTGQAIWNWKNARNKPSDRNIKALAAYLDVSPAFLKFGTEESKESVKDSPGTYPSLSNADRHAMQKFAQLSGGNRKLVREIIAALSK